jgi:hypothetical protein
MRTSFSTTIQRMALRRILRISLILAAFSAAPHFFWIAQQPPASSGARILLLPRKIVSGERATLAVLDVNGRLTPGVTVSFSNGDRLTTDVTGRALFVAPLNPGVIFGSITGRPDRVATAILTPAEAASASIEISTVPKVASVSDRFEISGRGFCGDADLNQVIVGGQPALILASSPASLVVLPPMGMKPGAATVEVSCATKVTPSFLTTFVALDLEADSSPLKPGEHRFLTVRVRGTIAKISLEARNLAPDIAELAGGAVVKQSSSGSANNTAQFEVVGRKQGSFMISIRLVPMVGRLIRNPD